MTFWNRFSGTTLAVTAAWICTTATSSPLFGQALPKTQRPQAGGVQQAAGVARSKKQDVQQTAGRKEPQKTAMATGPGPQAASGEAGPQSAANLRLSPELEKLLSDWEAKSANIKRVEGAFTLYKYDSVFQTETRAVGTFWHESPDKGRMDFKPFPANLMSQLPKNAANTPVNPRRKGANGQPFEVKAHQPELWVCDGVTIRQALIDDRTYNEMEIPPQFRGDSIKNSPLPFLFGLRKEEAKERYMLSLGTMHGKTLKGCPSPVIHIVALPLRAEDAQEWSKAEALLLGDTFLPHSIKTYDPAGTTECVYLFENLNGDPNWVLRNPFNVSMRGLTKIKRGETAAPSRPVDQEIVPTSGK